MKNNPEIEWKIHPPWPVTVHICEIDGIHHPLTPEQVRQFYRNMMVPGGDLTPKLHGKVFIVGQQQSEIRHNW
ncbi:MAG: hypothetical protein EG822_15260 [Deltaproteobacteria bacterium]|nr:hypothetical protein [Deltaproteobacteria bacterium]TLN03972.1 MAG: hypothetical protein FDZ73_05530 [bacterium]